MIDFMMLRLHELMVVLYALCILLYFIDFLHNDRKAKGLAFWLLSFVWLLQTIFLILFIVKTGRFPLLTIFEGLYFYAWLLISLSLVINRWLRIDFLVFFINIIGFLIMVIHIFAPLQSETQIMNSQLISELLFIHIIFAIFSYVAFSLSFVLSVLYIIQFDLLKGKKWGKRLWRLPDLSKLDRLSYRLNVVGVPLLFLSLILGVEWALIKLPDLHWLDAKVLGSFLVLVAYSFYLFLRVKVGINNKTLALFNIGTFLIVLTNFFLFGKMSTFHFWSW